MLIRRHQASLARFCRGVLRHDQDAEDALHAAMLRAYGGLREGAGGSAVRAWLFWIARNECLRVIGARPAVDPLDGTERSLGADPPQRAQARDDLRRLRGDLLALPERQRAAIVLRELCGASHARIGEVLGTSPAAVEVDAQVVPGAVASATVAVEAPVLPPILARVSVGRSTGITVSLPIRIPALTP